MKRRNILLFFSFLMTFSYSCKKDGTSPQNSVSLVGKWFVASRNSTVSYNGTQFNATLKTNFTTEDFIQYFSDGSGILSTNSSPAASLTSFTYTLTGENLVQFNSGSTLGVPETIIKLTKDSLAIHYALLVADPNTGNTDNETEDYIFKR